MHIDSAITTIYAFATHPGPCMQEVKAVLPDTPRPTGYFSYKVNEIKGKMTTPDISGCR